MASYANSRSPIKLADAHNDLQTWALEIQSNPDLPEQIRAQRLRDLENPPPPQPDQENKVQEELTEESIARFDNRFVSHFSIFIAVTSKTNSDPQYSDPIPLSTHHHVSRICLELEAPYLRQRISRLVCLYFDLFKKLQRYGQHHDRGQGSRANIISTAVSAHTKLDSSANTVSTSAASASERKQQTSVLSRYAILRRISPLERLDLTFPIASLRNYAKTISSSDRIQQVGSGGLTVFTHGMELRMAERKKI